jgi:hypothetical protein
MESLLNNTLNSQLGDISTSVSLVRIVVALLFGYLLGFVYRYTHTGISYSSNFTFTILTAALLSAAIIIVIGENVARAFALVGALAIIRFRTVVKDPKDLTFIFASLVVGMAVGVGLFAIALSIFTVFSLTAIIVKNGKIFAIDDFEHILRIRADGEVDVQVITNLLSIYVNRFQLLGFEYLSESNQSIITYELSSLSEENFNKLQENIHKSYGEKLNISFVAGNSSITY